MNVQRDFAADCNDFIKKTKSTFIQVRSYIFTGDCTVKTGPAKKNVENRREHNLLQNICIFFLLNLKLNLFIGFKDSIIHFLPLGPVRGRG